MILYCDTSALAKFYLVEKESEELFEASQSFQHLVTHESAYVEMLSALARSQREDRLTLGNHKKLVKRFQQDWPRYLQVKTTPRLLEVAGDFCLKYPLKALDSLHLASAHKMYLKFKESLYFIGYDHQLNQAAKKLKLNLLQF